MKFILLLSLFFSHCSTKPRPIHYKNYEAYFLSPEKDRLNASHLNYIFEEGEKDANLLYLPNVQIELQVIKHVLKFSDFIPDKDTKIISSGPQEVRESRKYPLEMIIIRTDERIFWLFQRYNKKFDIQNPFMVRYRKDGFLIRGFDEGFELLNSPYEELKKELLTKGKKVNFMETFRWSHYLEEDYKGF
jgi:hypothetical protein